MSQHVILVDEQDEMIGTMEKMEAHQKGLLHRAFSVFIFNSKGEMLLQQRALGKYHSAGLWSNACCSHPAPGEQLELAAQKRLEEEMGFVTGISRIFSFIYKACFDNGLTEHEYDHVFAGEYEGPVIYNDKEAMDTAFRSMQAIKDSLHTHPHDYTAWFHLAFPKIETWWNEKYG